MISLTIINICQGKLILIKIKSKNESTIFIMQIDDYLSKEKILNLKFETKPKWGVSKRIRYYFKMKEKYRHKIVKAKNGQIRNLRQLTLNFCFKWKTCIGNRVLKPRKKKYTQTNNIQQELLIDKKKRITLSKGIKHQFIDRFPSISSTVCEDFCTKADMCDDWNYFQEVPEFHGLFQQMIRLNSFTYWDSIERNLRKKGFHPNGFGVKELFKWILLRHSSGIRFYTHFHKIIKPWDKSLLFYTFDNPSNIPKSYHYSHMYSWLKPKHFKQYFMELVKQCIDYGIIIPRIAIADGYFTRSWAGNFTKDKFGNPTDPDASITVHDRKFYGKGYTSIVFIAWCGDRWLPVWCKTYTGSISENKVYTEVVGEFLRELPYEWKVMEYDRGADSKKNREFNKENGLIGVIGARKNIKYDELIEIRKGKYFCRSDIPDGMGTFKFARLSDHRAQGEFPFSTIAQYFNMKEMNSTGIDFASIYIYEALSLLLLHAITAFKVNRPDLIMSSSSFTHITL